MKTIQLTTSHQLSKWAMDNEVPISKCGKTFYVSTLTEQEKDDINLAHKQKLLSELKLINNPDLDCTKIVGIGSQSAFKPSHLSEYVGWSNGPRPDTGRSRARHYRDYSRSEEAQENTKHYGINVCEDSYNSAKSLLRAIRGEYLCIWYSETKPQE